MRFSVVKVEDQRCVRCPTCGDRPGFNVKDPFLMVAWLFGHYRRSPNCWTPPAFDVAWPQRNT